MSDPSPSVLPPRRNRARLVALGLAVLALGGFGAHWLLTHGKESTDDAQIEGHVYPVSPRIGGQVVAVKVTDNQRVAKGDVLVELDRADLELRLAAARADRDAASAQADAAEAQLQLTQKGIDANLRQASGGVTQASSGMQSLQASAAQARADVDAAEARLRLAQSEQKRARDLFAQSAVTQSEIDIRQANLDQAQAQLEQARARERSAVAGVTSGRGAVELAEGRRLAADTGPEQLASARAQRDLARARLAQSEATLHTAELALSYATVRAPAAGVVSRRNVEPGQLVGPDRALLALVATEDLWVVANFKEDQIGGLRPGQPTDVDVDAFPGRGFHGHVDSVAGATGARFALLPPDNASGNFVKVVQRVPVLIRLDGDPGVALRPGLSAKVTVRVK